MGEVPEPRPGYSIVMTPAVPSKRFQDRPAWYLGVSAYWFATSFKWFLLFLLLPVQVAAVVPEGEKNTWWGLVVFLGALEAMVGPAIFGALSDRCGSRFGRRRPFIAIGAACTALALLFLGGATQFWMLVVGYLFLQISDDIATGPYAALIPDLVPPERRGRASGMLGLLQLLGQIGAAGTGLLLQNLYVLYVGIAVVNLICAAIVLLTVRGGDQPAAPGAATPGAASRRRAPAARLRSLAQAWLAPWRSPDFRWVWITRFLNALGFYLILLYLTNYLTDRVGRYHIPGLFELSSPSHAAMVLAVTISLSGAVAAVIGGPLADRIGRKQVIFWSGWLMFAVLVPFSLVPVFALIMPLAVLFGFGYGSYLSASWALAADTLPNAEDSGKDMGIWQMSVATPQLLAGLVGVLVDLGNRLHSGLGYSGAFFVASFIFLAGAVLVRKVKGST
jgi:MFS family permease